MFVSRPRVAGRSLVVVAALVGLLVSACAAPGASPVSAIPLGPSPLPVAPVAPAPVVGPPFTIQMSPNSGVVFTDASWGSPVSILLDPTQINPARPVRLTVNCGTGAALQELPGFSGQGLVTCAFATPGTFRVTTTATAADGFSVSDATTVIASTRPLPPPPPDPLPTPPAATPALFVSAGPTLCTTQRAFWSFSASTRGTVAVDQYTFNFGDGSGTETSDVGAAGHAFDDTTYYTVKVTARRTDTGESLTKSVVIFAKLVAGC